MRLAVLTFLSGLIFGAAILATNAAPPKKPALKAAAQVDGYPVGVGTVKPGALASAATSLTVNYVEACVSADGTARLVLRHKAAGRSMPDRSVLIDASCKSTPAASAAWCTAAQALTSETQAWVKACAASGDCNL